MIVSKGKTHNFEIENFLGSMFIKADLINLISSNNNFFELYKEKSNYYSD